MMKQLYSYPVGWLRHRQALHTTRYQQPWLWRRLIQQLQQLQPQWQPFLQTLLRELNLRIVLCDAGSSDFVGRALAPWLCETTGRDVVACATTDIVPAPLHYLHPTRPTLLTLLTLGSWPLAQSGEMLQSVADWCDQQQASWRQQIKPLARGGFTRVVCLGAGCLCPASPKKRR